MSEVVQGARRVRVAAIQMACDADRDTNVRRGADRVREAAAQGAQIVLLPELFEGPYFCKDQDARFFDWARPYRDNPTLARFSDLAAELGVVLPVSFFESANNATFNSIAIIDADGKPLGLYRKSHIPDGPGYSEKYYFSPGDTGFRVWQTRHARLGVAICWDQWFPEAARSMALMGAELLMYPSAIGSEPADPAWDSSGHWRRVMQGHAGANLVPLVAVNRIGAEQSARTRVDFYGTSFIADETGAVIAEGGRGSEEIIMATLDLDLIARRRRAWGIFRDRRPDLYGALLTLDGDEDEQ